MTKFWTLCQTARLKSMITRANVDCLSIRSPHISCKEVFITFLDSHKIGVSFLCRESGLNVLGYEARVFESKVGGFGRGVKEKQSSMANKLAGVSKDDNTVHDVGTLNEVTLNSAKKERVAYTVVANYVRNTWGKYGLVRSMFCSSIELFSFQFSSIDGLYTMLENGPWFIQNHLLILKKWHPDENLLKEDVSIVLVWVKLYGVPVTAFIEDGLSAITTKLGRAITHAMSDLSMSGNLLGVRLATSSGSSFMNIDNDGEFASNTPIGFQQVVKMEVIKVVVLIARWNNRGNPNNDDYDPYDDDMYENHDLS
uniref:DUF4283 domain-containing protein n=1 Tax=Tanacetum cinerariifolium TaxID=118510 RepID=A0A6L2NBJ8_TANCI|nr:hypothetical protein [Tanacetum cinerariifolium]